MPAMDTTTRDVLVPVRGTRGVVHCRVPAFDALVLHDWHPLFIVQDVIDAHAGVLDDPVQWVIDQEPLSPEARFRQTLDRWIIQCVIAPKIVATEADAIGEACPISALDLELKFAIYRATFPVLVDQYLEFLSASGVREFVAESDRALLLDRAAHRYGQRPSAMLGLTDPVAALDFDLALALRADLQEIARKQTRRLGGA